MPEVAGHGNYGYSSYAFILVLFILLAIIGCACYGGYTPTCGCGYGY